MFRISLDILGEIINKKKSWFLRRLVLSTVSTNVFQITNLMNNSFILWQYTRYIIILDMFQAALRPYSGQIVLLQLLVSSLSVNGRTVL